MSHPSTQCKTAAHLYMAWTSCARVLNGVPESEIGDQIEQERQDPRYQAAYIAYMSHVQNCPVCREACREMNKER